jgi:sugar lactone lactonase YvrE
MKFLRASSFVACAAVLALGSACGQSTPPQAPAYVAPAAKAPANHGSRPIATATKKYLYVSNGQFVYVYSIVKHPKLVFTVGVGLSNPLGITIDKAGTLYVANNGNATVTEYPAGQYSPSVTLTQGMLYPNDVAVDSSGNVWVSNGKNVLKFPAGSSTPSETITDGVSGASGIAVGADGTVYVNNLVGTNASYVAVYPPGATKPKKTFGQGTLAYPIGITLDTTGNVYVGDFIEGAVFMFSHKNYKLRRTIVASPYFMQPGGVTIDVNNTLYVGGGGNSDDVVLFQFARLGKGAPKEFAELSSIYGVAADPSIEP